MSIDKSIYYNIDKLLSYSAIINIGIGGRGIGKTYQVKKHLLKKYRENGEQHEYDLYSVNKYPFKDLFKQCMNKKESAD